MLNKILNGIEAGWNKIRFFAFNNRSIFELLFLFLYTAEQLVLVWLVSRWNLQGQQLLNWVSYFALIVLFTFGLHKLMMESRIKMLEQEITSLGMQYWLAKHKLKELSEAYANLRDVYGQLDKKAVKKIARYINLNRHMNTRA
ncbi:MAG: hypothetical protein V1734_01035 [Nanoarchaeota archaeon]